MLYNRLTNGLADKGILIPSTELQNNITDYSTDWYSSVYFYGEKEYEQFKKTGSVAGITGLKSNKLIFDFDAADISVAQSDCLDVSTKLIQSGINEDQFNICFSGNKGFSIELTLADTYSESELKGIAKNLAGDKSTWDTKVYNSSRIFRVPYTKHPKSGLYKLPISLAQLSELNADQIKELATDNANGNDWKSVVVELPESLKVKVDLKIDMTSFVELPEFERKAKWMPACRELILNGFFPNGHRNHALMSLAATFKSNGFPKEVAHRSLKGAAELQAKRHGVEKFDSDEIWKNIISVVYSPTWKGATYSCKDHEWLSDICKQAGKHACALKVSNGLISIDSVADTFERYAKDIEKNTVKLGIDAIDNQIRLQTSSHIVIAGCSGSGKTHVVLNILNQMSKNGIKGIFNSLDMGKPLIYQRLAHKVTGYTDKELYSVYLRNDVQEIARIRSLINEEYKNVLFDFKTGLNIETIRTNVMEAKDRLGDELKVVVVDFINKIQGPYSEETANLAYIAPRLSDLANDSETLIISLAQTARSKGGPAQALVDSRISKGSSAIEESATLVAGIWRPGYNTANDNYLCFGALKTRMGKEFVEPLHFNGLTGDIRGMNSDEKMVYDHFIDEMEEATEKKSSWD